MSKRNRATLKKFFKQGSLPSEEYFHDLIDSTLNLTDDGLEKSPAKGLELSTLGNSDSLISFFRNDQRMWLVGYDGEQNKLLFRGEGNEVATLSLLPDGKLGINTKDPEWPLDVGGVIRAEGRIGIIPTKHQSIPADGQWHNITGVLTGCQAFEVMAGVGKQRTGRYALMHAIALNTFNPFGAWFNFLNFKKRIRCHQAHYRSFRDRLKLRWYGTNRRYVLQLRSNSDYEGDTQIRYHITKLWFDEDMSGSMPEQTGETKP